MKMFFFYEPLEQFEIIFSDIFRGENFVPNIFFRLFYHAIDYEVCYDLFYIDFLLFLNLSFWNISLFRTLFFFIFFFFLIFGLGNSSSYIFPRFWQIAFEFLFKFLAGIFKDQVGFRGQKYFSFFFTVFFFIFFLNIFGMIPYEGAVTGQLIFNLSLSFSLLIILTLIGILRQKLLFFQLFLPPKGIPQALFILLIFIEIVSYLARGISLGVRLFANIMAGHTLLFIFSSFILNVNLFLGLSIFFVIFLVIFLEFFISSLQAYVFYVLLIMYFKDSIEVSH